MLLLRLPIALLTLALSTLGLAQDCSKKCQSYGMDFQDGGSYFQNINSSDPFTAFQEFKGCQNDESHNVLVSPDGDQYECSQTNMQPDLTQQLVTCPIDKDQLVTGGWAMIVMSNNGQCDPIDYIRQFSLSVGLQATKSVGATITLTSTSTPIAGVFVTVSSTVTSTAPPVTKTTTGTAPQQTVTVQPSPAFTIVTKGVFTVFFTSTVPQVVATSTITATTSCAAASVVTADRVNRQIPVTIGPFVFTPPAFPRSSSTEASRALIEGRNAQKLREIVQVRSPALQKRHPDSPTTTVIDSAVPVVTSTITTTTSTVTVTGTATSFSTTTTTPTLVLTSGQTVTTITNPQSTNTAYFWIPYETSTVYVTSSLTATATKTTSIC